MSCGFRIQPHGSVVLFLCHQTEMGEMEPFSTYGKKKNMYRQALCRCSHYKNLPLCLCGQDGDFQPERWPWSQSSS